MNRRRELVGGQVQSPRRLRKARLAFSTVIPLLPYVASGMSNNLIAQEVRLTEDAVKSRIADLLRHLNAVDRAHAVAIGYERGILPAGVALTAPATQFMPLCTREDSMGERESTPATRALGAELFAVMSGAGLTSAQLARKLGWAQSTVSRLIYGKGGGSRPDVKAWLDACRVAAEKQEKILAMALPCRLCGCTGVHPQEEGPD